MAKPIDGGIEVTVTDGRTVEAIQNTVGVTRMRLNIAILTAECPDRTATGRRCADRHSSDPLQGAHSRQASSASWRARCTQALSAARGEFVTKGGDQAAEEKGRRVAPLAARVPEQAKPTREEWGVDKALPRQSQIKRDPGGCDPALLTNCRELHVGRYNPKSTRNRPRGKMPL